jgi:uncharacterized protein YrzB (UPF0473 family)
MKAKSTLLTDYLSDEEGNEENFYSIPDIDNGTFISQDYHPG